MACADCEYNDRAVRRGDGTIAYFRWGNANIGLIGCDKDVKEVMAALRKAQDGQNTHMGLGDPQDD